MSNPDHPSLSVVGLGGSAGGIKALLQFFHAMPPDSGMAFVVILHLSDQHDSTLDQILRTKTRMEVSQVTETVKVEPNHVYVIPPAKHLEMVDGTIRLTEPERIRGRRVPIDHFFRTLADAYGTNGIAIILSGTGSDGTLGLKRIKETGGLVLAQEPTEAEFCEMPQSAIATKMVDIVLPVEAMPQRLLDIDEVAKKLQTQVEDKGDEDADSIDEVNARVLRDILTLVRIRTGHDFTNYKRPTIQRRISKRLHIHQLTELPAYLKLLRNTPEEVHALLRDLLITVTNFFRDKESFAIVEREIIAQLFEDKGPESTVRVWVAGCATGEEAYSLAILLTEYAATLPEPPKIQIFASDINEEAIRSAREGRFDEVISADVSPERLQQFFTRETGSYRIKKEIRDLILFTPHNLLRDPPFSRLDLIACRNLLIYLSRETQERVLELFHFALRPDGILLLGSSESAEALSSLFAPLNKKHRIYQSRPIQTSFVLPLLPSHGRWQVRLPEPTETGHEPRVSFGAMHYQLLEHFAPPSVLINAEYEIVHSSENAGRFLRFSGGEPSRNLLEVVHPALQLDVRALLLASQQDQRHAEARNVRVVMDGVERGVNLRVRSLDTPEARGCFLVIFDESGEASSQPSVGRSISEALAGDEAMKDVMRRLEEELNQTRDRLRSTVEQSEASGEEMRASNEELQAINEELRSASEELETSKEELHSLNEELTTVNHELKEKVDELSRANSDLQNLMAATDIPIVFLDRALRIKRFTPRTSEVFNIIPSDLGRPLEHLTHKLDYQGFEADATEVLQNLRFVQREARGPEDRRYLIRLSPYRSSEDRIDGVVLCIVEVSELARAHDEVRERERLLRLAQEAVKAGIWKLGWNEGTAWWSDECFRLHNLPAGSVEMTLENWLAVLHPHDRPVVEVAIRDAITHRTEYNRELRLVLPDGQERWLLEAGQATYDSAGKFEQFTGITLDITDRVAWREEQVRLLALKAEKEEAMTVADRNKSEFLAMLAHELRNPLAPIASSLELLHRESNPEEITEAREVIERQFRQIVHLVDDLLDIARINEGKIRLRRKRLDLADAINLAIETTKPLIVRNGHHLKVTLPSKLLFVEADETRLAQAFQNVLNNAAKFCPKGSEISVSCTEEGDFAVVRLSDNGSGIPPNLLPKIFDIFTQGESKSGQFHSGLGVGLTVVKRMIEMHNGSISVQSAPDKGSEFIIHLPLAKDQKVGRKDPPVNSADQTSTQAHRVLIIDDNVDGALTLQRLLARRGHVVRCAHDGRSGLEAAEEFKPDTALLDIGLPDMEGYDVARALRKKFPSSKLIAVSGWGQDDDILRAKAAGFDSHLVKPVEIEGILRLMDSKSPRVGKRR